MFACLRCAVELRLMPNNIILAEGFTLMHPTCDRRTEAPTIAPTIGEAGVTHQSVIQLYLLPDTATTMNSAHLTLIELEARMGVPLGCNTE